MGLQIQPTKRRKRLGRNSSECVFVSSPELHSSAHPRRLLYPTHPFADPSTGQRSSPLCANSAFDYCLRIVDQAAMQSNLYSNPLPHVLILTAIVVGIATTSLGLALIVRIRESFNTIDEEDILQIEQKMTREDNQKYKDDLKGML